MNWFSDLEDLGVVVLGLLVSVMAGALANTIGGPGLAMLTVGCSIALFGTLLATAHDTP